MIRSQRTLKKTVSFQGMGLHTGQNVSLQLVPSDSNTGIVFQRIDLPGKPIIPATLKYVQETARSTTLGIDHASVQTVEHLLAALFAFNIDNLCIQVDAAEPPISDGSSLSFVELIENAGILEQDAAVTKISLPEPIYYSQGDTHLVALPSHEYRISCTLHYPKNSVIRSQYYSINVTPENFKKEIAPCRTFALYEEITALMNRGLIRGGSLENAIVIKDDVVLSKDGLRFPEEMVRHKLLDLIGDLSLIGTHFLAHIIAIRSGHAANIAFGKEIAKRIIPSKSSKKAPLVGAL